ncbi:MAG: PEP-CTERM sorting domain-containing protein [Bryobacteraceae bacterium]
MGNVVRGFVSLLVVAGSASALRADSIFDFSTDTPVQYPGTPLPTTTPPGTQTTFTNTNNGISATFSSLTASGVNAPSGFIVQNYNTFVNFSGPNSLYESDFVTPRFTNLVLDVNFSSVLSGSSLQFALNQVSPQGGNSLTLTAFLNGTQVGTTTVLNSGTMATYLYGSLSFGNVDFNSIVLSSNTIEFAIDDLDVTPAAPVSGVPEPAPTALIVLGVAGLLAYIRRHKQKKAALDAPAHPVREALAN